MSARKAAPAPAPPPTNEPVARPNHAPKVSDCADCDPVTWRMREGVSMSTASQPADTQGLFSGWDKKEEQRVQVAPRKQLYAFDPIFMTDPNIYMFERNNQPLPRKFYRQTRKNKPADGNVGYDRLGNLTVTAKGNPATSIYIIEWERRADADLVFKMYGEAKSLVVEGYCKKTDYGGQFKWVAVVTELHGGDLPADQSERLFSYPLYGALASGVSFGIWYDDEETQRKFPNMGSGVPRDEERDLRESMSRNARLRSRRRAGIPTAQTKIDASLADDLVGMPVATTGTLPIEAVPAPALAPAPAPAMAPNPNRDADDEDARGAVRASIARPANRNANAKLQNHFVRFTPKGKSHGAGMGVYPAGLNMVLGAIFPIRRTIDIRADGLCITYMTIVETPVKFAHDPALKGVSRYTVKLFADGVEAPVGTLAVTPDARPQPGAQARLKLVYHKTQLEVGSVWNVPGAEDIVVTDADANDVATRTPAWDRRLMSTIEASMWQLRMQNAEGVARFA